GLRRRATPPTCSGSPRSSGRPASCRSPSTGTRSSARSATCSPADPGLPPGRRARLVGRSIPVVLGLVGPRGGHAEIGGLLGGELRERHAELLEMQAGDLLVERLRQHVDLLLVLLGVLPELELREHLVGE